MPHPPNAEEILEAELTFREQADGRKVARLPGGKVVLVNLDDLDKVGDGERWRVRLRHRETFAIADPLERLGEAGGGPPVAVRENGAANGVAARVVAPPVVVRPVVWPPAEVPLVAAAEESGVADAAALAPARAEAPAPVERPAPPDPHVVVRPSDRVAMFVDGANMDGACRRAGYFVDYRKAREFFLAGGLFNAAYYYIADFTASDPLQQRFLDFLARSGYIVRRRPVKVLSDEETGERFIKGNLDTEIVLDMLNTVDNYDVAFLFSGDSDFERAVDLLRSRGKRIYIVTSARQLSRELMYVADKPIFLLEDYRDALVRDDRWMPRNPAPSG
jgi:uncharacterized LabA/DUF88 family protein